MERAAAMFIQHLNGLARDRRGVVSIYFSVILTIMMVTMLAAVDMLRVAMLRSRVQSALDSAVLAVGYNLTAKTEEREADGKAYFNANMGADSMGATIDGPTFLAPVNTVNGTLYTITATVSVPLMVTAFTSGGAFEFTLSTTARRKTRSDVEVVLAIDNTGSMQGAKMAAAQAAAKNVVSTLLGSSSGGNTFIGLVPFTETVNVGNNAQTKTWLKAGESSNNWNGCLFENKGTDGNYSITNLSPTEPGLLPEKQARFEVYHDGTVSKAGSYSEGTGQNYCISSQVTFLTSNKTTLDAKINAMKADGNTMIAAGAIWGGRMLLPNWNGAWDTTSGRPKPAWDGKTTVNKVLVLLTDGDNNVRGSGSNSASVSNPYRNPRNAPPWGNITGNPNVNADNILWNVGTPAAASYCQAIKAAQVTIFTIPFDTSGSDISTDTDKLLKGCATSSDHFIEASDKDSLNEAFSKVVASLEEFVIEH